MRSAMVVLICLALACLTGCRAGSTQKAAGPLFVCFIVDSSASVSGFQSSILQYAQLALDQYSREGQMKVTVINLNEKPTVEFQTKRDLFEEDIPGVINQVKNINYNAKGTDIVSAFELASQYFGYEQPAPSGFKLLCFTDGVIEGTAGQKFRRWSDFDWSKLQQQGANVGLYFINPDPKLREEIQVSVGKLGNAIVKNNKEAVDDLKQEEPDLP